MVSIRYGAGSLTVRGRKLPFPLPTERRSGRRKSKFSPSAHREGKARFPAGGDKPRPSPKSWSGRRIQGAGLEPFRAGAMRPGIAQPGTNPPAPGMHCTGGDAVHHPSPRHRRRKGIHAPSESLSSRSVMPINPKRFVSKANIRHPESQTKSRDARSTWVGTPGCRKGDKEKRLPGPERPCGRRANRSGYPCEYSNQEPRQLTCIPRSAPSPSERGAGTGTIRR